MSMIIKDMKTKSIDYYHPKKLNKIKYEIELYFSILYCTFTMYYFEMLPEEIVEQMLMMKFGDKYQDIIEKYQEYNEYAIKSIRFMNAFSSDYDNTCEMFVRHVYSQLIR